VSQCCASPMVAPKGSSRLFSRRRLCVRMMLSELSPMMTASLLRIRRAAFCERIFRAIPERNVPDPRSGHCALKARTLSHNLITRRNKCWLETLTLHGSPSRRRHPALMASVSPHTGAVLATKFSIMVNIDQPRIGVLGQDWLHRRPNRQLSATERSVMLPPNTGEA
jgi:hypothetical protein